MHRLRWPILLATAGGLAAGLWAIGAVGLADMAHSALRLGIGGFALFCLASSALFVLLGGAWLAAMPGERAARLPLFSYARAAREGANEFLPFSQVGALLVGGRALTTAGLAAAPVYAGLIVDLTTEMASQLFVTLYALWALGTLLSGARNDLAWGGAAAGAAAMLAFVLGHRALVRIARRLAARLLPSASVPLERLDAELDLIYANRRAVFVSFLLNLAAWIVTGLLAWWALRLMGSPSRLGDVLAMEWLVAAIRSVAFLVPGAIGVQEAGYALLAVAFGIDPRAAVALSFVKRARDVLIGVPALLVWQAREAKGHAARGAASLDAGRSDRTE